MSIKGKNNLNAEIKTIGSIESQFIKDNSILNQIHIILSGKKKSPAEIANLVNKTRSEFKEFQISEMGE